MIVFNTFYKKNYFTPIADLVFVVYDESGDN